MTEKASWRDFLSQFEMAARENGWDKKTRAVRLACNLRGSAQALLSVHEHGSEI